MKRDTSKSKEKTIYKNIITKLDNLNTKKIKKIAIIIVAILTVLYVTLFICNKIAYVKISNECEEEFYGASFKHSYYVDNKAEKIRERERQINSQRSKQRDPWDIDTYYYPGYTIHYADKQWMIEHYTLMYAIQVWIVIITIVSIILNIKAFRKIKRVQVNIVEGTNTMNNTDNNSEKTKDSKKKHFTLNGKVHFIIEIILVLILVLCIDNYLYLNNKVSDLEAKMEKESESTVYKAIENFFNTPEEVFIRYGYGSDERKASITEYLYTMPNDEHNKGVLCPDDNVYYYSEYNSQSIIDKGNEILKDELRKEMMQREVIRYSDQIGELKKPVIYLYGYNNEEVNISLVLNDATLSCSYPEYNNGWKIKAQPDGHLIDEYGNTYKYLYWEAESNKQWDMSDGFCIKGENTAEFLEKSLKTLGLNSDEINEFISYWLPQMKNNKFNVIKFQDKEYLETAKINIDNKPDNMIRVFMTWYPSDEFVEIEQQELNDNSIDRSGKTLVEWGGTKVE